MAENEDGQEKAHDPTAKRLDDARKKGQVPRSKELNTMAITLAGTVALLFLGQHFAVGIAEVFNDHMTLSRADLFDKSAVTTHLANGLKDALSLLLPFFAVTVVVAILSSVALGGFNISAEALTPKLSKLDPIKGLKKLFSARALMELLKALAKFLLIAGVTMLLLLTWIDDFIGLGAMDVNTGIKEAMTLIATASIILASTFIVLALVDVPFQIWNHKKELKMTQKEMRDEMKDTEGKPEVRSRIRQLQREMAQRRMMEAVPEADVIVTNPTHFAVALKYDETRMRAPVVVARGVELVAANIRRVAEEHNVMIIEAPVLARAIYYHTELNDPIPIGLYLAIAQLLAYVYQLKIYDEEGGEKPVIPEEFPVPEELQHD